MDGRAAWPDAERVERLLGGGPAAPHDPADVRFTAVVRVLAAATRESALDPEREQAALAGFRAARAGERPRRTPVRASRSAKVLVGGLLAALAVGGVSVAAGAGVLPRPFGGGAAVHAGALPVRTAPTTPPPAPGADSSRTGPRTTAPRPSAAPPAAPPSAAVPSPVRKARAPRALCRAYEKAVRQGGRPKKKVVAKLTRAAGRKDLIPAYCRALLATDPPEGRSDESGATVTSTATSTATTKPPDRPAAATARPSP